MTESQIKVAAQRIFEMRCSIVPDKAQLSLEHRKLTRKKIEAHTWRKLLASLMADSMDVAASPG
jgi:hypothetical protein